MIVCREIFLISLLVLLCVASATETDLAKQAGQQLAQQAAAGKSLTDQEIRRLLI